MPVRFWLLVGLLAALSFEQPAAAQPPAPANPAKPSPPRRIYVPFDELDTIVGGDAVGVLIPKADYDALVERAQGKQPDGTPAIVGTSAAYQVQIVNEQLVVDAQLEFTQSQPGPSVWDLPFKNLAVESAQLDDAPAAVARAPGAGRELMLFSSGTGRHTLKLTLSTPLAVVGSDQLASLGIPALPTGTADLEIPAGKFLQWGDATLERPAPIDQPAKYTLAVGGRKELSLRITDRRADQSAQSLVFAASAIGLHVAPEEQTWRAVTALNVFGQPIDALTVQVPSTLQIVSVESIGLDRWEIVEEQGVSTLRLTWRQPFNESRTIVFQGISGSVLGQQWSVPRLQILKAAAHQVGVLVQSQAGLRLKMVEAAAVRRVGAGEAAAAGLPSTPDMTIQVAETQQLHYAAWRDDFTLVFVTQPRSRELWSTITTSVAVGVPELRLESSIRVQPKHGALFDFDLALPADWIAQELLVNDKPTEWRLLPSEPGSNLMRVMFDPAIPSGGSVNLRLTAAHTPGENWPPETTPLLIALPEVQLPASTATVGRYTVVSGSDLEVTAQELTNLDPVPLNTAESAGSAGTTLAWEHQDARYSGQLKIARRPVRLFARTLAFHRLGRETVSTRWELQLVAQGGGARRVQIALPEKSGGDLQFQLLLADGRNASNGLAITEQSAATPANGERVWTISFSQRVLGTVHLGVDLEQARPSESDEIALPGFRVLNSERQFGQVAVEAAPDQRLEVIARDENGQPLREIDAADLPHPDGYTPAERVVAAFEMLRPGERLRVREERYSPGSVPTAICEKLRMTSVLGSTGELQHRAEFVLRAVGVQSLLVQPPGEAELWATLVDGQPLEVRRDQARPSEAATYFVPLPAVDPPDRPRAIRLYYRTHRAQAGGVRSLYELPPRISVLTGAGEKLAVDILERDWELHHPANSNIIRSKGNFEPDHPLTRNSILGSVQRDVFRWNSSHLITRLVILAVIFVGVTSFSALLRIRVENPWKVFAVIGGVMLAGFFLMIIIVSNLSRTMFTHIGSEMAPKNAAPPTGMTAQSTLEFRDESGVAETTRSKDMAPGRTPVGPTVAGAKGGGMMPGATASPVPLPVQPPGMAPREADMEFDLPKLDASEMPADPNQAPLPDPADAAMPEPAAKPGNDPFNPAVPQVADPFGPAQRPALSSKASKGRLSLSIDLQIPPESASTRLRYAGVSAGPQEPSLELEVVDEREAQSGLLAWLVGMVVLFWMLRRASWPLRTVIGIIALALPWALLPVMRLDFLPVLDGIFLGACCGWLLWGVVELVGVLQSRTLFARGSARVGILGLGLGLGLTLVTSSQLVAQETPPPTTLLPENTIVLPYDPAEGAGGADQVFVPWNQYLRLKQPDGVGGIPAGGANPTIAAARYTVRLRPAVAGRSSVASVTAQLTIHSRDDRQASVPLPFRGVSPTSAELDGKSAPLVSPEAADGALHVLIDAPGRHDLIIEFDIPIEANGPTGNLTLPLTDSATGWVRFVLPAAETSLRVSGAARGFRRTTVDNEPTALIPLENPGAVTLAWGLGRAREAGQDVVHTQTTAALSLSDSGVRFTAHYAVDVRKGAVTEVAFRVPEGWLVRQIAGVDLAGWELADAGDTQRLQTRLKRSVTDTTALTVDLFRPQVIGEETATIAVPDFAPLAAVRETGLIGVFVGDQFAISSGAAAGVSQEQVALFPAPNSDVGRLLAPTVDSRPVRVYRYASRPMELQFLAARQRPVSRGVAEHALLIAPRRLTVSSRFALQLAGAPRSEISFQLPEGFLLFDVHCDEVGDFWVTGAEEGGAGVLHLELLAPKTGALELTVDGMVQRLPDDPVAILVPPAPNDIGELRSTAALWVDPAFTARVEDSTGWKSADPSALPATLPRLKTEPARFAFTSTLPGTQPMALLLDPAEVRVSTDSLSQILVRDTAVDYMLYLRWNITAAAARRVAFTVPEWIADRLELTPAQATVRIRQTSSETVPGNRRRFQIELEEPQSTELVFTGVASFAIPESGRLSAPLVTFEQPIETEGVRQYRPVDTHRGFVVLVNQSWQRAQGQGVEALETVSADDLPIRLPDELRRQATGLWRVRDSRADVAWQLESAATVRALGAAVNYAGLTQVLTPDGSWRMIAEYRVINRARQYLPLRIPAGARILSVFVDGRPDRPIDPTREGNANVVLIPLPRTAAGDLASTIQVVMQGRLPRALPRGVQFTHTTIDLPAPQVVSAEEDPQHGLPVAATEWNVYVSDRLHVKRIDDPDRTNVAETAAGLDKGIAAYQEWLELYRLLGDPTLNDAALTRCTDNLNLLDAQLTNYYNEGMRQSATANPRVAEQQRELAELRQRVAEAKQRLPETLRSMSLKNQLSNVTVQRELVAANSAPQSATPVSGDQLIGRFGESKPAAVKSRESAPGKRQRGGRAQLNSQLEEQTILDSSRRGGKQVLMDGKKAAKNSTQESGQLLNDPVFEGRVGQQQVEELEQGIGRQSNPQKRQNRGQNALQGPMGGQATGMMGGGGGAASGMMGGPGGMMGAPGGGPAPAFQGQGGELAAGGLVLDGQGNNGQEFVGGVNVRAPTGLSLKVDIPKESQRLTFTKSGGQPRLALGLRPQDSMDAGWGLLWAFGWLAVAGLVTAVLVRTTWRPALIRLAPWLAIVAGGFWFLFVPEDLIGLALFVVGLCIVVWRRHRLSQPA